MWWLMERIHKTIMLAWNLLWFPIAVLLWAILTGIMGICFFGLYALFYHKCYGWKVLDKDDDFYLILFKRDKPGEECAPSSKLEDGPHGPCGVCEVCQAG
jgi:hypothetical protein